MCGRYYVDEKTLQEILKILKSPTPEWMKNEFAGEFYPGDEALVLLGQGEFPEKGEIQAKRMRWGFPGFHKENRSGKLIFNARSEGVMVKPMFRESAYSRHCLVPAKGFYEWDQAKNKVTYEKRGGKPLYMAGIWKEFGDGERFVILTTQANASVREVHDRMPLILEKGEAEKWIRGEETEKVLDSRPEAVEWVEGYVQQSIF